MSKPPTSSAELKDKTREESGQHEEFERLEAHDREDAERAWLGADNLSAQEAAAARLDRQQRAGPEQRRRKAQLRW